MASAVRSQLDEQLTACLKRPLFELPTFKDLGRLSRRITVNAGAACLEGPMSDAILAVVSPVVCALETPEQQSQFDLNTKKMIAEVFCILFFCSDYILRKILIRLNCTSTLIRPGLLSFSLKGSVTSRQQFECLRR